MKKTVMLIIVLGGFLLGFSPVMGDKDKSEDRKDKPKVSDRASRGDRSRGGDRAGRRAQNSIEARLKGLQDKHNKLVGELGKIRGIAKEEGASRTANKVEALIDSLNKEHEKVLKRFKQARNRTQKQRIRGQKRQKPGQAKDKQGKDAGGKKDSKDE